MSAPGRPKRELRPPGDSAAAKPQAWAEHTDAAHVLVCEDLPGAAKSTLRRRRRRFRPGDPDALDLVPEAWRALLLRFVRRAPRTRWSTLLADAGAHGVDTALALVDWLRSAGWITTTEAFERGRWVVQSIEFRHLGKLRAALGVEDPDVTAGQWQDMASRHFDHSALDALQASLDATPARVAVKRHALLLALAAWIADRRFGTRRDFALFARGATKSLSDGEWRWLSDGVDLDAIGVTQHATTIELRAPAVLVTPAGRIELGAAPDFISVTVATIESALAMEGDVVAWRVIENRTSFERVARAMSDREAVVWLPGYPPSGWRESMSRLVALKPAPAHIACDPDPDGIQIATLAARIWTSQGCPWTPWRMDAGTLAAVPTRRRLTSRDRLRLESLAASSLPRELRGLAEWMLEHGEKGEQESYL